MKIQYHLWNTEDFTKEIHIHNTAQKVSVFGVIQSECGKIRTRITPNTNIFHAVLAVDILRKNGHHRRLSGSWIHFCQFKIASFPVKWIKDDTCENWTFRISVSFKSYFSHWLTSFTVESVVLIWYYIFSSENWKTHFVYRWWFKVNESRYV